MPIVPIEDFHPHTGAYWKGYEDAWDLLSKLPPEGWDAKAICDYAEGYDAALAEMEAEKQETQA